MKFRIELDPHVKEDEVVIRCRQLTEEIGSLQKTILEDLKKENNILFFKDGKEYYFDVKNILFFETSDNAIYGHTKDNVYLVKYKLYELENILPKCFVRISKAALININHIYSIEKNITSASLVQFYNCHKKVYVSRNYYKILRDLLKERRNYER